MKARIKVNDVEIELETTDEPPWHLPPDLATSKEVSPKDDRAEYDKRMGILSAHHLTVAEPVDATWIIDRVRDRITDKVVVEIGAGTGYLAVELAQHAARVYAIEPDVRWSWEFASKLYATKPRNLTWIFDRAEAVAHIIKADVAIVVTGSDDVWLRELAGKFAPVIIMPWQDYNGGKARISNAMYDLTASPAPSESPPTTSR